MNWYKLIKISSPIIEKKEDHEKFPEYFEIGHRKYYKKPDKECKEFIWAFINGNLEVFPTQALGEEKDNHYRIFRDRYKNIKFLGRVSQCKNETKISLSPTESISSFRDIPDIVLSKLYDRFGSNAKIYVM